jgi:hypothetical protein
MSQAARIALFEEARRRMQALMARHDNLAFRMILEQLDYVLALERGEQHDRDKLARLTIGRLAAREVEDYGELELAELLYLVEEVAQRLP